MTTPTPAAPDRLAEPSSPAKRLEVARDNLARIVEDAEDAIIGKDLNGLITFWNKGAGQLYGYAAAQILGKPVNTLAPPERRDEAAKLIARVVRGEAVEHYETERVTNRGKRIWVSLRVSPVRNDAGELTGLSTVSRDITARRETEAKLRAASLYARSLIEASLDPLVTISAEGKITDVNKATEEATGAAARQADRQRLLQVFHGAGQS